MAEAGTLVDEWLTWQEGKTAPTFSEMEEVVLVLRERLAHQMLDLTVTEQEALKPVAAPRCE